MASANNQGFLLPCLHLLNDVIKRAGSVNSVIGGTDRERVCFRTKAWSGIEFEAKAGGVDEVIEALRADFVGSAIVGAPIGDEPLRVIRIAERMDLCGGGLDELNPFALIDRCRRKEHFAIRHRAHTNPDIGRNPISVRVGRDDNNSVPGTDHSLSV